MARLGRSFPIQKGYNRFTATQSGSGAFAFSGNANTIVTFPGQAQAVINIVATVNGSSNLSGTATGHVSVLATANNSINIPITPAATISLVGNAVSSMIFIRARIDLVANLTPSSMTVRSTGTANIGLSGLANGFYNFKNTYSRASGFPVSASSTALSTLNVTTVNSQDLLILYVANLNAAGFAPTSISCPNTEGWSLQDSYTTTSGYNISIWTSVVNTAGSTTITVTWPSSVASDTIELVADEIVPNSKPVNLIVPSITGTLNSGQTVSIDNGIWSGDDSYSNLYYDLYGGSAPFFTWTIYNTANFSTSSSSTSIPFPSLPSSPVAGFYSGYVASGGTPSAGSSTGFTYSTVPSGLLILDSTLSVSTTYAPTATQTAGILGAVALTGYASDGVQVGLINIVGNAVNSSVITGSASISLLANNIITAIGNGNITLTANISNSSMSVKSTGTAVISFNGILGASGTATAKIAILAFTPVFGQANAVVSLVGAINPIHHGNLSIVANVTAVPHISDFVRAFVTFSGGISSSTTNSVSITPHGTISLLLNAVGTAAFSTPETLTQSITLVGFVSFATVQFATTAAATISLLGSSINSINISSQPVGAVNLTGGVIGAPSGTCTGTVTLTSQGIGNINGSGSADLEIAGFATNSTQSTGNTANVSLLAQNVSGGFGTSSINLTANCSGNVIGLANVSLDIESFATVNTTNLIAATITLSGLLSSLSNGAGSINLLSAAAGTFNTINTANAEISFNGKVYTFAKSTASSSIQILAQVISFHVRPNIALQVPYNFVEPGATLYPLPLVPNNL